ncbi:MAG: hypothetical protein R3Y26_05180 [Rikenellaceae bacterium]
MKPTYFLLSLIASLVMFSCNQPSDYITNNNVKYIKDFPANKTFDHASPIDIDLRGVVNFFIAGEHIYLQHLSGNRFWSVYSINDKKHVVDLLDKGSSRLEFTDLPSCEDIYEIDSVLYCNVKKPSESKIMQINLTESILEKKTVIKELANFDNVSGFISNCFQINDTSFFISNSRDYKSVKRFALENNKRVNLKQCEYLNTPVINEDMNTLSAIRTYNRSQNMVAEGMLRLNQINVYSLDKDNSYVICVGDELSDYLDVDRTSKRQLKKYYGHIYSNDKYYALLYHNKPLKSYLDYNSESYIQFFSWEGAPLSEIKFTFPVTAFSVKGNDLYVLSLNKDGEEVLYNYNIQELL